MEKNKEEEKTDLSQSKVENPEEANRAEEVGQEAGPNISEAQVSKVSNVNLMTKLTQQEEIEVSKKHSFELKSVVFILFVVVLSVGFILFTAYVERTLEGEEEKLEELEETLYSKAPIVLDNNEILLKYELHDSVMGTAVSSREILEFWSEICDERCDISSIEIDISSLQFEIVGTGKSLMDTMQFWHFLGLDIRVSSINLDSFSLPSRFAGDETVRFTMSGDLNKEYFD